MNKKINDTEVESVSKVLIVNNQNKALVLTLSEHRIYPELSFTPDLPGGIVEANERELDAAIREAREESGIELTADKLFLAYAGTEYKTLQNKSVSKFLYITTLENTPDITLSWEHSSYEWVSIEKLLDSNKFRPFFEEAIRYSMNCGFIHI